MNTRTIESPLLTNNEAMAFFRIKDPHAWLKFQRENKIPYQRVGSKKFFHRDLLNKIAIKAHEATARKVYL